MQPHPIPNATGSPDDTPRPRTRAMPPPSDPVEVIVTGIHLTFDNVLTLLVMFVIAQAILGLIVFLALYLLGVF